MTKARIPIALGLALVLALGVAAISGCTTPTQPAETPQALPSTTPSPEAQTRVDAALAKAKSIVDQADAKAAELESKIKGLQVKAELDKLDQQLTDAMNEAADKKAAAVASIDAALTKIITKIDAAAALLPAGDLQTQLKALSNDLKSIQSDLNSSAGSSGVTTPTTP